MKKKFFTIVSMIFLVAILFTISGCGQENNEEFASQTGAPFYETQKEKTGSDENCSIENTQVYIGENGNLHYIANIYSLAGADKYQNEFDYGE